MGGSGEVVTFREYEDGSNRIARLLRAAGLSVLRPLPEDRLTSRCR
jgi:hypothetical protein